MKTNKAFKLTSPFKQKNEENKKSETKSSKIYKSNEGVVYRVNTSINKSGSAGSKIAQQSMPNKVEVGKAKGGGPKATDKGAYMAGLAKKYPGATGEQLAEGGYIHKGAAKEFDSKYPAAKPTSAPSTGSSIEEEDKANEIGRKKQYGATTLDLRGAIRSGKYLARAAGQTERKAARQDRRAARLEERGKSDRANALRTKADMNREVSGNAKQYLAKLKEQSQQGVTGHGEYVTNEPVTLAEQNAEERGLPIGTQKNKSSVFSSSNNGFNPGDTSVPTDSGLIKSTPDASKEVLQKPTEAPVSTTTEEDKTKSPAAMKSAPFKMKGFGSKSGLYKK